MIGEQGRKYWRDRGVDALARHAGYSRVMDEEEKSAISDVALSTVHDLLQQDRLKQDLLRMHWTTVDAPSGVQFFTSDRPTIRTSMLDPAAYWVLPIGPRKLFLATFQRKVAFDIARDVQRQRWKAFNHSVVSQAELYVYASSNGHLNYVQKHFSTNPARSIIGDPHPSETGSTLYRPPH